jgi:N-acetylglucosamine-6-phosphate deacetylase
VTSLKRYPFGGVHLAVYDVEVPNDVRNESTVFRNGAIYQLTEAGPSLVSGLSVRVRDSIVVEVGRCDAEPDEIVVDLHGLILAPGLIDIQCNGALGIDLLSEPERLWDLAAVLPQWGVTTVLPTFITSSAGIRQRGQAAFRTKPDDGIPRAHVAGLHLEGPFLHPLANGAHNPNKMLAPTMELIHEWHPPDVALITIAPELPGAEPVIRELVARGVVVSLGHSTASSETVSDAARWGARSVTHLFNAMSPLHHRRLGMVGSVLTQPDLFASLICDGEHVVPSVVALAHHILGPRLVLISDAVAALGLPSGTVTLGNVELTINETTVHLADGTLAGSKLSMDVAVRNLMDFTGCDLATALRSATSAPAALLGRSDIGAIAVGARADFVELHANGQVAATWVSGRQAFRG